MVQIFILLCTRILLLWNKIQSQIYSCYSNNSEEKLSCIMIFKFEFRSFNVSFYLIEKVVIIILDIFSIYIF